jgi:hypothetical protein
LPTWLRARKVIRGELLYPALRATFSAVSWHLVHLIRHFMAPSPEREGCWCCAGVIWEKDIGVAAVYLEKDIRYFHFIWRTKNLLRELVRE